MANEGRLAREALVVAVTGEDAEARLARLAMYVAEHFPEANTEGMAARVAAVVAISYPHGPGIINDPAL